MPLYCSISLLSEDVNILAGDTGTLVIEGTHRTCHLNQIKRGCYSCTVDSCTVKLSAEGWEGG